MTNTKPKLVKLKPKKAPLSDSGQIALVRDKLLEVTEELSERVTIPNMVQAIQLFNCQLAFDTAPSNACATNIMLSCITSKLDAVTEKEFEEHGDKIYIRKVWANGTNILFLLVQKKMLKIGRSKKRNG